MIRFFYNFFEKYKIILLFFLTLLSVISLGGAFYQAQLISFDFHFSPTKLVADGINHYEYILDGKIIIHYPIVELFSINTPAELENNKNKISDFIN